MSKIMLLTSGTMQMEAKLNVSKTAASRAAPLSWKKLKARN